MLLRAFSSRYSFRSRARQRPLQTLPARRTSLEPRRMYGDRFFQVAKLFGTSVHTNLEAILVMLAAGFAGRSLLHGVLIVASFMLGTGLHLGSHWLVSVAFGKGIDRMILTRAGRIDYAGAEPRFVERVVRTAAGPSMNAVCALVGYAVLPTLDGASPLLVLAVQTFVG